MKNIIVTIFSILVAIGFYSFTSTDRSGIQGTIDPPEGARRIWAVSGRDTVSIIPAPGSFIIDVKPGSWKLVVEAVLPYKNAERESILVTEGQITDIGLIKLVQ
ncbi:MAG TPA: hypothetical protein VJ765_05085 [Chitinophagaceae bacterium]|nr:hypothetical protein [Chitinophagaceae bacterium]